VEEREGRGVRAWFPNSKKKNSKKKLKVSFKKKNQIFK